MPVDLYREFVEEYAKIDEEESTIDLLIRSAIEYLKNAGIKEQESFLYNLAVAMLVTQWYEERKQNVNTRDSAVMEMGLQTIILQLKAGE